MLPLAASEPEKKAPRSRAVFAFVGFFLIAALVVGLRTTALGSDPYKRLDWSSGLLTDEGFYLHNARNLILFGRERTDDFSNSLLSPVLNTVQIVVFRQFGAGIIAARSLSVAAGLITLPLFFAALRRAYSFRAAALATVFLGLDHLPLLYSRMALMDTPAALVLTAAFYFWVRAHPPERSEAKRSQSEIAPRFWLFLCGAALGFAFATRGLCAFAIPVPLLILCRIKGGDRAAFGRLFTFAGGLAAILTLYAVLWAVPHHAELAQSNAFYLKNQLLPHSFGHLIRILTRSFFGDTRGIAPALIRHTPALFALALAGVLWRFRARRSLEPLSRNSQFLGGWLLSGIVLFSIVGYSPSRYYILFFPAFAAVAALSCLRLPEIALSLYIPNRIRVIFGSFFAYHLFLFLRPFNGLPGNIFVGALTLCAVLFLWFLPVGKEQGKREKGKGKREEIGGNSGEERETIQNPKSKIQNGPASSLFPLSSSLVFLLWASINFLWLGDWLGHRTYSQRDAGHWLTANLPPDAILIGDVAPGLSVNTGFVSIPVIPGLCNDNQPVERFADRTRAVIILDGDRREVWWDKNYPSLVAPRRAAYSANIVGFPVGIYLIPPESAKNKRRSR